ncbi:MAG: hypothetical protein AAFQ87_28570, partial [Bacteroidota bacterium]
IATSIHTFILDIHYTDFGTREGLGGHLGHRFAERDNLSKRKGATFAPLRIFEKNRSAKQAHKKRSGLLKRPDNCYTPHATYCTV